MSQVRIFRVPNKLREKILKAGGPKAFESVAKAGKNLDAMRGTALDRIEGLVGEIVQTYGRGHRKGDEEFLPLYMLATRIIDTSAPVHDLEIDRAAFHMCELVDRCMALGRWDWPSVDVHIDALQLLRAEAANLPAAARAQIFSGLKKVYMRLPDPPPEAEAAPAEVAAEGAQPSEEAGV